MKTTEEIYKWLKSQNYQTEFGEQEYRMYYAIDMPKILEAYHESRMKEIPEIDNDAILTLPLDVPSDEEIEKKAISHNRTDNYTTIDYYSTGIIVGSKWVRDEILKRNK